MDELDMAMVAPLSEPFARFAWKHWVRTHGGETMEAYRAFVRAVRSCADALDAEFATVEMTTGLLRDRAGVQPSTIAEWRRRGLIRQASYGHPDYAQAIAVLVMRQVIPTKRREWLPSFVPNHPTSLAWWCFDLDQSGYVWHQTMIHAPKRGLRVTPWNGAVRYGWIALPEGGAMDTTGLIPEFRRVAAAKLASVWTDTRDDTPSVSV